jgi:8-amino-7-oxononanoate synthase
VGIAAPAGAVLSVPMPGPHEALAGVATAAEHGLRIGCFRPPSTPDGVSRLRLTAHAHHTDENLTLAAKILRLIISAPALTVAAG